MSTAAGPTPPGQPQDRFTDGPATDGVTADGVATDTSSGNPPRADAATGMPTTTASGTSTATLDRPVAAGSPTGTASTDRARRSIPLGRLVATEVRKLVDTRGALAFHLVTVLLVIAFGVLALFIDERMKFENARIAQGPLTIMLPVLGVLVGAGEWTHRSAMVTFTLEPRRLRVVVAKTVALLVAFVAHYAIAWGLAALLTAIKGGEWDSTFQILAGDVVIRLAQTIGGFAIGMVVASAAIGIVVYFVVYLLLYFVSPLFALWSPIGRVAPWIVPGLAYNPINAGFDLSATEWGRAGVSFGIWVVFMGALGAWLTVRREAK